MNVFGYSIVGFLVAIAILVTVHEFGHFWVARILGIKVLKFSIGFGKSFFSWRRKNDPTEYVICMIPLGGYVRMLDENDGDVAEHEKHKAFNRQSLLVRSAVVLAGPAFNFLFAICAIWLMFVLGTPDLKPIVGQVRQDSLAAAAGFMPGDRILEIDQRAVATWRQQHIYLMHRAMQGRSVAVSVQRQSGQFATLSVALADLDHAGIGQHSTMTLIGIYPLTALARIRDTVPDLPAALAGLQAGDLITRINDEVVQNWWQLVNIVSSKPGAALQVQFERDGELLERTVVAQSTEINGQEVGLIGIYPTTVQGVSLRLGLLESVGASIDYNWRLSVITVSSLWRMLTAQMSSRNLSGPITIARVAGDTVEAGLIYFLHFLALISISLGLVNLLPIPILDGGHLVYILLEGFKGSPLSENSIMRGQQIGIVMLAVLMGVAFYNDIVRLVELI